jgi:hypothetical protein
MEDSTNRNSKCMLSTKNILSQNWAGIHKAVTLIHPQKRKSTVMEVELRTLRCALGFSTSSRLICGTTFCVLSCRCYQYLRVRLSSRELNCRKELLKN